jgi:RNA polymerase sigma-70 factor, ECF subfamily
MRGSGRHDTIQGSDRDLWSGLRSANEQALTELFHRHADAVYNYAFRRVASWAAAEDVVQATFVTLWRRARSGRVDDLTLDSARPLLLVMAGHECRSVLRASRRRAALVDRMMILVDRNHRGSGDPATETVSRVDDERAMSQIRRILDKIPAKQREVVELVVWSECSMAEAADVLGVPEGTVKSRLARARTKLAGLIDLATMMEELS